MENRTEVSEFILMGFTKLQGLENFLFTLFLLLMWPACWEMVAMALMESRLHTPMYFFLGNLSCLDMCYSTVTVPKMLSGFLSGCQTISFADCLAQLHFFHFLGSSEAILLAIMAYDRYVAICNPLRYSLVMSPQTCLVLAVTTWSTGFLHALMHTVMTSRLHFCGSNLIPHFFCDIKPLLSLACSSTHVNLSLLNIVTGGIAIIPFILILLSYFYIISFLLLKVQLRESRRKAFSTCVFHLTVVFVFYGAVILTYVTPSSGEFPELDMMIILLYSVVTPVLNPVIYTLRNKEVQSALRKNLHRKLFPGRT